MDAMVLPQNSSFNVPQLPQNVAAYFNRPARVTKQSSRNHSPRNRGGRRMTTHLPTRTRSVADSQRSDISLHRSNYAQARPTSWHAAFMNEYQYLHTFPPYFEPQQYQMPGDTTLAHGLLTPGSFPVMDAAFLDCPNVPLDQIGAHQLDALQNTVQFPDAYTEGSDGNQAYYASMGLNPYSGDNFAPTPSAWPYLPAKHAHNIQTAPVSPEIFPFQGFENIPDSMCIGDVPDRDELVGMGLYDSPAEVQSASLLFSGSVPVRRKSLKLEESFEPGPLSDTSDEDAESDPTQQDYDSVISADCQPEAVVTVSHTPFSMQPQAAVHDIGFLIPEPTMAPMASIYQAEPVQPSHHASTWF